MWQTVPERRTGSSERSVADSTTMSARHVELQRRRREGSPQTSYPPTDNSTVRQQERLKTGAGGSWKSFARLQFA